MDCCLISLGVSYVDLVYFVCSLLWELGEEYVKLQGLLLVGCVSHQTSRFLGHEGDADTGYG